MIKLYVSDLDGTLLNKFHKADKHILDGIEKVFDSNKYFSVATGRSGNNIDFDFDNPYLFYITLNGAAILNYKKEIIRTVPIAKETLKTFATKFKDLNFEYQAIDGLAYSTLSKETYLKHIMKKSNNNVDWYRRFIGSIFQKINFNTSVEELLDLNILKITARVEEGVKYDEVEAFLKEHDIVNAPSYPTLYEITDVKANKADAAMWLADYLNIDYDEVAVYGDGGNDIKMLETFKNSYAPNDASQAAKEKAHHIIGSYIDYSVIDHIVNSI